MNFVDELKSAQGARNLEQFGGTARHRQTFRQNQRKALRTVLGDDLIPDFSEPPNLNLEIPKPEIQPTVEPLKPNTDLINFTDFVKLFFIGGYKDKYSAVATANGSIFTSIASNYLIFYKNYQFILNVVAMTSLIIYSIVKRDDKKQQRSGVHYLWVFIIMTVISPVLFWIFWSQFINLEYLHDLSTLMV